MKLLMENPVDIELDFHFRYCGDYAFDVVACVD